MGQKKFYTIVSDILVKNSFENFSLYNLRHYNVFRGNVSYVGWYNILFNLVHSFESC